MTKQTSKSDIMHRLGIAIPRDMYYQLLDAQIAATKAKGRKVSMNQIVIAAIAEHFANSE